MGFHTPFPPPGEEGILINFGNSDLGLGPADPASSQPAVQPQQEEVKPVETKPVPSETTDAREEILTQDMEKSVALESKKVEKKKEKTPEQIEQERLEKERIEKIKAEERVRIEQERLEKIEKEKKEQQAKEINQRIGNLFSQGKSDGTSGSEGIAGGEGNQGKTTGSVDSKNYGDGSGLGDKGISFSLAGRSAVYLPAITDESQKEGIVVVEIKVNNKGDVISAIPGGRGTTIQDAYLFKIAKEAALKVRFNEKPSAPDQIGTISIRFVLE
jgi:colicin import membrane protein